MSIENNVIMGRRPGISNTERLFRAEIARKLLAQIGAKRGARTKAAATLGVCKQAMSLYLNEKATPGSEVLRRACLLWNLSFEVEGTVVNSSSFRQLAPQPPRPVQLSLPKAISEMKNQQLTVKVLRKGPTSVDLEVSIDFKRAV
jgi:hypothetical protein